MTSETHYILIDFENVQPKSLEAFEKDHCKILLFVGASQAKLPFEVVSSVQRMGTRAEYIKISGNGPNALDFHIAYYIGRLAASEPQAEFHIISKDTGFDPLIQHLKAKNIRVTRTKQVPLPVTVKAAKPAKAADAKTPKERLEIVVAQLRKLEASKPRKVKTLSSTIAAIFKGISDDEIESLVADLQAKDFIAVTGNDVTYTLQ